MGIQSLRHTVSVIIFDPIERKLLILARNPLLWQGWGLVSGGVEEGESIASAAVREIAEEIGVIVTEDQLVKLDHRHEYYHDRRKQYVIADWFALPLASTTPLTLQDIEWTDAQWMPIEEGIKELTWPAQQKAAEQMFTHILQHHKI